MTMYNLEAGSTYSSGQELLQRLDQLESQAEDVAVRAKTALEWILLPEMPTLENESNEEESHKTPPLFNDILGRMKGIEMHLLSLSKLLDRINL